MSETLTARLEGQNVCLGTKEDDKDEAASTPSEPAPINVPNPVDSVGALNSPRGLELLEKIFQTNTALYEVMLKSVGSGEGPTLGPGTQSEKSKGIEDGKNGYVFLWRTDQHKDRQSVERNGSQRDSTKLQSAEGSVTGTSYISSDSSSSSSAGFRDRGPRRTRARHDSIEHSSSTQDHTKGSIAPDQRSTGTGRIESPSQASPRYIISLGGAEQVTEIEARRNEAAASCYLAEGNCLILAWITCTNIQQ